MRLVRQHLPACLSAALLAGFLAHTNASEILVVTDQQHPVVAAPANARVILLDTPVRLKAQLSADLPSDPDQASRIVRQRLAEGGSELQRRFQHAYQDVTEAWRLGVTKVPAVVVDRRHVIYGERNVEAAVARIQNYRSSHP